ncbi:hypothetical protein EV668_3159 [Enterovirga rhinocerotis]|uniref:Uncharacterized protein n=1 Tax=Enterovirga rhinocerotis TaxID=1339210 RepID=A0A4R7BXJ9_9HYPH|nr:hypothetical protein EV668_3159 [Enterovirga rhinocerotis]
MQPGAPKVRLVHAQEGDQHVYTCPSIPNLHVSRETQPKARQAARDWIARHSDRIGEARPTIVWSA